MKAKEYFKKYQERIEANESENYALVSSLHQMLCEVKEVQKARNARSNSAMIAIFNEMNNKCNKFVAMINNSSKREDKIKHNAFKLFLIQEHPNLCKMIGWS